MLSDGYNNLRPQDRAARRKRVAKIALLKASLGVEAGMLGPQRSDEAPNDSAISNLLHAELHTKLEPELTEEIEKIFSEENENPEDGSPSDEEDVRWSDFLNLEEAVDFLESNEDIKTPPANAYNFVAIEESASLNTLGSELKQSQIFVDMQSFKQEQKANTWIHQVIKSCESDFDPPAHLTLGGVLQDPSGDQSDRIDYMTARYESTVGETFGDLDLLKHGYGALLNRADVLLSDQNKEVN